MHILPHVGAMVGRVGPILVTSWHVFGERWGHCTPCGAHLVARVGAILTHLRPMLAPRWTDVEAILESCCANLAEM